MTEPDPAPNWGDPGGSIVEDDDTTTEPRPRSWSSDNPSLFYQARDFVFDTLTAAGWSITQSDVTRALNAWAIQYQGENDGQMPTVSALQTDPMPWIRAQRNALRSDLLPTIFVAETPEGTIVYENRPELGPLPVPRPDMEVPATPDDTFGLQQEARFGPTSPDFVRSEATGRVAPRPTGVLSQEYVDSILNLAAMNQQRPPGPGRASLAFDSAQLAEAVRDRWRTLLRQEPPNVDKIVKDYISDANTLFRQSGARRDFDTWVLNQMRQTPRYRDFYGEKPETMSELDYLNSFVAEVEPFGLRARQAEQQIQRGLTTGAAPASFAQSVATSRDVSDVGQGSFSRRFANLLSQLGPLQRT